MARILLAYSTVDGHTRKICERLRQHLQVDGHVVILVALGEPMPADLASCDKVVIGASIRYGKHRPAVYEFIRMNQRVLESRPSAFFTVNVVARKPGNDTPDTNPYMKGFLRRTTWRPALLGVFAGKIDYPRYGFLDRQVIRSIMWLTHGPTGSRDCVEFTDWAAVRSLWLQKNFRPSRFLAIVRNPYAVCEGIRRRRNYTIHQAVCHWVSANAYMLHDMDFLENSMLVRYEDLTELTDDCLVSIQHFLGLETPFDRLACDSVSAHSLDGDTFGLRNLNEKSIVHLSACDIQEINNICGDMMRCFGYVMR